MEDVDGAVGAHGKRSAERVGGLRGTDDGCDDLGGGAGLAEPQCLLHGNLAEGVHGVGLGVGGNAADPDWR